MDWLGEEGFEFGPRLVQSGGHGSPADGQVFCYLVVRQLVEKPLTEHTAFALGQLGDGLAQSVGQLSADGVRLRIAIRTEEAQPVEPAWATKGRFALPQTI